MKLRKLAVITLIVGILLIVGGLSIEVYSYISDTNKEKELLESDISTNYEAFRKKTEVFYDFRTNTYYNEIAKNLYLESVSDEYENWINILNSYTDLVNQIENSSSYLKQSCIDSSYSNEDIQNKCEAFVIAYETVINYYTKDINSFNDLIKEYLESNNNESIKEYDLNYEYIDINNDGKFIGKD